MIAWLLANAPIFTALSALVATLTFVVSTISSAKRKRAEGVREWQRVVIAEIFQSNPEVNFSFSQLLEKYHSAATSYAEHKLGANDLSKSTLRRIVVELVESRVIEQMHDDTYRLDAFDRKARDENFLKNMNSSIDGLMTKLPNLLQEGGNEIPGSGFLGALTGMVAAQSSGREAIRAEVLNFIAENPDKFTAIEVGAKVGKTSRISPEICAAQAHALVAEGTLETSSAGKLSIRNQMISKGK